MKETDGQLHTLSVLEQLREASKSLWGASSAAYFRVDELLRQLANPNLHDIPHNLPFRVEMWDRNEQHVRWVISASASCDWARSAGRGDRELSGAALYVAQRHTCHPTASAFERSLRGIMSTTFSMNCERSFGCRMMPAIQRFFGRVSVRHVLF
jgi:hypothetical protein